MERVNIEKENEWREEFEKAKSNYFSCDKSKNHFGQYQSIEARCSWEAYFQACRARQSENYSLKAELDECKKIISARVSDVAYWKRNAEYFDDCCREKDHVIMNLDDELEKARELIGKIKPYLEANKGDEILDNDLIVKTNDFIKQEE